MGGVGNGKSELPSQSTLTQPKVRGRELKSLSDVGGEQVGTIFVVFKKNLDIKEA